LPSDAMIETYELDRKLVGATGAFLLTVTGEQLEYDGCRGGDLLLVEAVAAEELENGDVIGVRVGGEPTAKRYRRRGGGGVLEPARASVAAMRGRGGEGLTGVGGVLGVVRRLRAPVRAPAAPAAAPEEESPTD